MSKNVGQRVWVRARDMSQWSIGVRLTLGPGHVALAYGALDSSMLTKPTGASVWPTTRTRPRTYVWVKKRTGLSHEKVVFSKNTCKSCPSHRFLEEFFLADYILIENKKCGLGLSNPFS